MSKGTYQPQFHWQEVDGADCLLDRKEKVFVFEREKITLRNVCLRPGGYPLVEGKETGFCSSGWPAAWGCHGTITRLGLLSLDADDSNPEAFTLRVISDGPSTLGETDWKLRVTYDSDLKSYVYDVDMTLEIKRGKNDLCIPYNAESQFEYFDLFPAGMTDPETLPCNVETEPQFDQPLWQYFVYEDQEIYGNSKWWMKFPLNRFVMRNCWNIHLKRNGRILLANSQVGNPAVQLLGDTAACSWLVQCNMLYDMHFTHFYSRCEEPPTIGTKFRAQWRMMNYDSARVRKILKQAVSAPVLEDEKEGKAYPRYEENAVNSFEEGARFDVADHSRLWRPFHGDLDDGGVQRVICDMDIRYWDRRQTSCVWDRTCGRTGSSSLRVTTKKNAVGGWQLVSFDMLNVSVGKTYEMSAYVKTESLTGKGATIGYLLGRGEIYSSYLTPTGRKVPRFTRKRVKGTRPWTRVSVVIGPVPPDSKTRSSRQKMQVVLWHEGKGTSWFDDFEIREQKR